MLLTCDYRMDGGATLELPELLLPSLVAAIRVGHIRVHALHLLVLLFLLHLLVLLFLLHFLALLVLAHVAARHIAIAHVAVGHITIAHVAVLRKDETAKAQDECHYEAKFLTHCVVLLCWCFVLF